MRELSRDLWRICRADKGALAGGVIILIYLFFAIFGPYITHASNVTHTADSYLGPSWKHPLGTDSVGQGILAQLIVGTRPIMEVGIIAAVITVVVGVAVGLGSGYAGGFVDSAVMRVVDVFLTIPGLPLIIVIASFIRTTNPFILAALLSVTAWAGLARAVRSQALSLRSIDFMEAARVQGLSLRHIVARQLLPNVGPYVAIHFLLAVTGAIYAEVGLFLLGVAPVTGTNWGIMINLAMSQGALYTSKSMLYLFAPMAAIVILQMAFVFFSRALDQFFNPRLRVR
ncbi:MAG TPA: ABC transporter permease [Mycobacteriales bacterium]|jgi:peptide/nickel transport system permease protein|nr:ABC transporter permease [Mycobacteriales bacterium]